MKKLDFEKMTAPCGLACFNCVVYLANTDEDIKKQVATQFNIPPEKVGCPGCRAIKGKDPVKLEECKIYKYAKKKSIKFCCDCPEVTCDFLYPHPDKSN